MATARSANSAGFDEAGAETLATRRPMKTRNEISSLSDASVLSTLPRRTDTPVDLPRTATASAASAPAFLAASTRAATLSTSLVASRVLVIGCPGSSICFARGHCLWRSAQVAIRKHLRTIYCSGPSCAMGGRYTKWGMCAVGVPGERAMSWHSKVRSYSETLLLLGGAVVSAPLFKRIGLGTILGYLAAGVAIGPAARLITGGEQILHVAELGIVFLLFIIGLELKPSRLWALRREIFGLGLSQVVVTGTALAALGFLVAGLSWQAAIVIGFGLALSSTAFAMQILDQEGTRNTRYGQTTFSILLFQDLAIVPLLALIPLLAPGGEHTRMSPLPHFAITIGAIAALLVAGRYLLNPPSASSPIRAPRKQ